ncbi:MAG: chemotaxis protein CheD [bacterium]|nr:chemotaxis protein CheD [bacterium]
MMSTIHFLDPSRAPVSVGISDFKVVNQPGAILATHSLGSCLGVTAFDAEAMVGGMLHCLLPDSKTSPDRARQRPAMFVDTGIEALLNAMYEQGAQRRRIVIKLAGAGQFLDKQGHFRIGDKNYAAARKSLWKSNLLIRGEDCGGSKPRTMYLFMATGETWIRSMSEEYSI